MRYPLPVALFRWFAVGAALGAVHSVAAEPDIIRTVDSFPEGLPNAYLGNGVLGYRIPPNPFVGWKAVASGYVMGFEAEGFECLAYAPYPFVMDFKLADSPSLLEKPEAARIMRQSLNLSCGELTTEMEFPLGTGTAKATVLQFVSRRCPVLACQEVRLTVPQAGDLRVETRVVTGPHNKNYASTPPTNERLTDVMLGFEADGRGSRCGITVKAEFGKLPATRQPFTADEPKTARAFVLKVDAGQEVVIRTYAATVTSLYHPDPDLESCRLANWGESLGFERLRRDNREDWAEIWQSRVKVTGDPAAQAYLDDCLHYLFASSHRSCRTSIPPFGTSQALNYYGHVFWDTDTYMMPALVLVSPETARATVEYRLRNLEAARRRAEIYGYAGAMYPWESDSQGAEATPSGVDTGWLEQHVNLCVAMGAWWYQQAAGDAEHARRCTWPIMKAVCEWIADRVEKTDRGWTITNVMSSHEGMKIDGSAYVNGVAAETLRCAALCAKIAETEAPPHWAKIAEAMFIPAGPAPADSGVQGDMIWMHDKGWANAAVTDMYLIGFPFDLPLGRERLRNSYDFFTRFADGAVLNMGTAFIVGDGAFLGDRAGTRKLFDRAARELTEPAWGMGLEFSNNPTTCFVTTMGGILQSVMMGMTGIRFEPSQWTKYEACLPEGWSKIEIDRIYLGGKAYRVEAEHGKKARLMKVTSDE